MPTSIVECVPNFSEARRPEVVDAIERAITGIGSVSLLDRHSDLDHNRTVLTFAGAPQPVEEAAFQAIAKAAELIDLDQHQGEHPRIGATDVVPFVPISGLSMQECVEMAQRLGQRVGEELGIPVYLYEEAATRPERQNLENIRRGQYEGLKETISSDPQRQPDYGPACLGPAGATVIGARQPLIAYNVYLSSQDVSIARKIAKTIRHSSGGLRFVKALGLEVDGQAQVSMNLTNFRGTPLPQVIEMIRREAARYGVAIHHSELVGLIPQEALFGSAIWYLQLDKLDPGQVLEHRLASVLEADTKGVKSQDTSPEAGSKEMRVAGSFLEQLAAGTPTPGGGAAAAYSAAAAAALVAMVARVTVGKKKYAAVEEQMQAIIEQADRLRADLETEVQRDSRAFEKVMDAMKLPKDNPQEQHIRQEAIQQATLGAALVPLDVARKAVQVLELAAQVMAEGNLNAISDGATGAALARAALNGAGFNIRINANSLQDRKTVQRLLDELLSLEARAEALDKEIRIELTDRGGLSG